MGCAVEEGHPPVARIAADPRVIPEHDGFQTPVTLDGSSSADPIDDPEGELPLTFAWRIEGDEFRFESGDASSPAPVVLLRGDRPATIELTVTDDEELSNTAVIQMQLTVP